MTGRDSVDWAAARDGELQLNLGYSHSQRILQGNETFRLALASPALAADARFGKVSLDSRSRLRFTQSLGLGVRLFAGLCRGNPPPQERFFLSGNLGATDAEPITWSYARTTFATQENWHIDGDANLRGFAGEHGEHIKGKVAAALNFSLPLGTFAPFFDIGNVGNSLRDLSPDSLKMDAGLRVRYGPLYADFPVWRYWRNDDQRPLKFRWSLGLTLSGLGLGL